MRAQPKGPKKNEEEKDFLDEMIAEETAANPSFPAILAAVERRRNLLRELAAKRRERGLSQTVVAARMGTSQSAVARLEGQSDAKESVIDHYAAAIGVQIERRIVEPNSTVDQPVPKR